MRAQNHRSKDCAPIYDGWVTEWFKDYSHVIVLFLMDTTREPYRKVTPECIRE